MALQCVFYRMLTKIRGLPNAYEEWRALQCVFYRMLTKKLPLYNTSNVIKWESCFSQFFAFNNSFMLAKTL